ncbi:NAD-dependent epimerase/dehydratase family protein [Polynucleobacter sp. AP-Sanab-80-C2]|uniref:NAD-dependent epimerase/dehydratase family protein n=1 Tax=Polynucleobacter sp. AP-Sanab-80-C2 TaxID=3108274 RepID=UPI002B2252CD|nr:NAD-dependent epimerase/dehydratase family protein [Polynucleobacter sp. AP-Sanab-80-C2]MEA9598554.1 NAD-dependent epimerase/dehydratase family protein [Polynucleobacter sp. AP-Sanab-80-C2]
MSFKDKKILITGGVGYLGSALAREINNFGGNAIQVSSRKLPSEKYFRVLQGDVCTLDFWLDNLPKIDTVYHFAGNTSVAYAESHALECLSSAIQPIDHLILAANILKKKVRVIFSSTATVYGLTTELPVDESTVPRPITNYDLYKLFSEEKLALAHRQGIIESISVRLSNVYGPSPSMGQVDGRGVLNKAAMIAIESKSLSVYGTGKYIRDYVYIDDVIRAFMKLEARSVSSGLTLNVGSGKGIALYDAFKLISDCIKEILDETVNLKLIDWPNNSQEIDRRNYVANIDLIKSVCGWEPKIDIKEGVNLLLNHYNSSNKTY